MNGLEVFFGSTIDSGSGEPSVGITYERRAGSVLGVGLLAEYTNDREWVTGVPFFFHLNEEWKAVVLLGTESLDGDYESLVRVGASYDIDLGGWSVAPELNFDFVDGEVKSVLGVSIGFEF